MISEFLLYSDWESNPDFRFRKPTFYPLNYQSIRNLVTGLPLYLGVGGDENTFCGRVRSAMPPAFRQLRCKGKK